MMKRIYLSILLIFLSGISFAQSMHNETDMRNMLCRYLYQYPQSQLRDIYKSYFQDYFGPGHILSDTAVARKYLENELNNTKIFGGPLYEPTGCNGNYYRVNILLVANGTIMIEHFMDAFIRSANTVHLVSLDKWIKDWKYIETIALELISKNDENMTDSRDINQLLKEGRYMFHHSSRFNETYNFHYRIIRKDIFKKEILPLIK